MSVPAILTPNQKHDQLSKLLATIEPKLSLVAPKEYDTKRFREVMLDLLMATPDLLKCAETAKGKMSFALACAHIVELGLDPSKVRKHVYVVPFANRKDNYMEAVVIPDARGLIELMRRSGRFSGISAGVVYHGDTIQVQYAPVPTVVHEPKLDRTTPPQFWPDPENANTPCEFNQILGFYAMLRIEGEEPIVKWWTRDQVMKTKAQSRAGGSGPWVTHFVQMGIKTVVKDAARHAPLSPEVSSAIALDEEPDSEVHVPTKADLSDVITIDASETNELPAPAPSSKTDAVKQRLKGKQPSPAPVEAPVEPTPTPEPDDPYAAPADEPEPPEQPKAEPQVVDVNEAKRIKAERDARHAEDAKRAQQNYEESLTVAESPSDTPSGPTADQGPDPNYVTMADGSILESTLDVARYYQLPDVRDLYFQRIKPPSLLALVNLLDELSWAYAEKGGVGAAVAEVHTARIGTWAGVMEHFKAALSPPAEEPAPDERELPVDYSAIRDELQPIFANEGLSSSACDWLVENRAEPKLLTAYIAHLRAQGVDANGRLELHAESGLSLTEAMDDDAFEEA